ncbi:Hypothetical predicted protein [Mytilus galloprovincialis]|uniref:Uncharacterized protein n=1 Tax=Mytilus galloprovincialis TaxID=29158 RepID=A0A8B6DJ44_MYTGA|nr:Hypothetical predicted protein [Mytilus galloprovincialis]
MSRFYCVVAVIFTMCHVVNAGSLTRQCHASKGTCTKQGFRSTCKTAFGPEWTYIGKCCRGGQCCKFQCEDLQPQQNGNVSVSGRDIGDVANFSCKCRYTLLGSQSLRCTDSGWDGDIPICHACPFTQFSFHGKRYLLMCDQVPMPLALSTCRDLGGHLPSLETREESNYLKRIATLINSSHDWWIGLQHNNTEGTFNWVSGQPLSYTDWYQGTPIQPDNKNKAGAGPANCAALVFSYQYQWGDENCDSPKQMICESREFYSSVDYYDDFYDFFFGDNCGATWDWDVIDIP